MDNLIKAIEIMQKKEKLKILKYLNEETDVKIFEHADGSRINLDTIDNTDLELFMNFVNKIKLENPLDDKYKVD